MRTTARATLSSLRIWWFESAAITGLAVTAIFSLQAAAGVLVWIGVPWLAGYRHVLRRKRGERRQMAGERREFLDAFHRIDGKLDAALSGDDDIHDRPVLRLVP